MIESIPYKSIYDAKSIENNKLVKAAIRCGEVVYTGWRHAQIIAYLRENNLCDYVSQESQGFIDQLGNFYRRSPASCLAFKNKQCKEFIETLTSEDLWDINGNSK